MDNFLKVFIAQFTVSQLILIDLFFFFFEVQTAMYTHRLNREVIAPQFVTMHFVSRKLHVLGGEAVPLGWLSQSSRDLCTPVAKSSASDCPFLQSTAMAAFE